MFPFFDIITYVQNDKTNEGVDGSPLLCFVKNLYHVKDNHR